MYIFGETASPEKKKKKVRESPVVQKSKEARVSGVEGQDKMYEIARNLIL